MKIYPVYPKPATNKFAQILNFFKKNSSWLDTVMDKSYTMYLGRLRLPGETLYVINDTELIQRVMISELDKFPKNKLLHESLSPLLGNSIFTTNGRVWKKQRELLNPSFEMVRVEHVFHLMQEAVDDSMKRLEKIDDGTIVDMDDEMTFLAADIIYRTILSKELQREDAEKIVEAFERFQEKNNKIGIQKLFNVPKFIYKMRDEKEHIRAGMAIRNALSEIIKPRYDTADKTAYRDILSSLLQVKDKDTHKPFTFNEIVDQVAMLFLAGHETSASSMAWALYLVARYPDIQEEAHKEIMTHCESGSFSTDDMKKLTLVTNIFKETLRLYPPVSFIPRTVKEEVTMRNRTMKKGDTVIISPWLTQRNERYWKDAHMFDPYRFDDPKAITKFTYLPFGLGQRNCIGAGFAMQEAVLVLATLLRDYKLELPKDFTPDIVSRLTTRSLNGMPIRLIRREK